jgi:hypothetical protein
MSSSHSKYHHPPASPSGSGHVYSSLNDEDKEKLRKKHSLKEILRNKRDKSNGLKHDKT